MPVSRNKPVYVFGPFRLDPTERQLTREGQLLLLTPKALDTLLALVERHGHLVEKEDLMKMVWSDAYVEEANLARCVYTLRKLLAQQETGQKYIETVPKRGYRFVAAVKEKRVAAIDKSPIDSIAVMPFVNSSGNTDVEYLSDGITESLIDNLSRWPNLKVVSRNAVFRYKGKAVDGQSVGNTLGVRAVLTGEVKQRDRDLFISVELIDGKDNSHLWGERYNRRAADLLQVQSEISRKITEKLRLRFTTSERQQVIKQQKINPQAYELVLKGRFYWNKGSTESRQKAIEYYHQATIVDSAYALPYAELAKAYSTFGYRGIIDPREALPKAEAAAMRALEIDETLPEAHAWLGYVKQCAWDWTGAEEEFKRAEELSPTYAEVHALHAIYLSQVRPRDQAVAEAKRAKELDPLSPSVNIAVFYTLRAARLYEQAIDHLKQMLELDQNIPLAHLLFGYIYAAKEQYIEAIAAYKEAMKLGIDNANVRIHLGYVYAMSGQRDKAEAILRRLLKAKEYVSATELAILYVGLGQKERAFRLLEQAYSLHDLHLIYVSIDPHFDSLSSDRRFRNILRRVGLREY